MEVDGDFGVDEGDIADLEVFDHVVIGVFEVRRSGLGEHFDVFDRTKIDFIQQFIQRQVFIQVFKYHRSGQVELVQIGVGGQRGQVRRRTSIYMMELAVDGTQGNHRIGRLEVRAVDQEIGGEH